MIFDLRNVNPEANISVKLVAEAGVGVVAAGVAKAHADKITISGDSGGTGASPLSSIQNAGVPWELGLAETHQTLLLNGLRTRVRLETDGQLRTGRDVAIAALLGAEEFGFATAPLIVEGCLMMRKCHLNTCPVGIATQDPELRALFRGKPEHVIQYFFFVAEELRQIMAKLGFRNVEEMIGRTDRLKSRKLSHWKARDVSMSALLHRPLHASLNPMESVTVQHAEILGKTIDAKILHECEAFFETHPNLRTDLRPVQLEYEVKNTNRSVGAILSGKISKRFGVSALPENTLNVKFIGAAGQSFGAFLCRGVSFRLEGDANDYFGKGLSGGKLAVFPDKRSVFEEATSIIIGNTALYGATSGSAFIAGRAGERFAVRNSGALAVVEGLGDHGCEYMTGGTVIVLGSVGKNFGAGMSGGIAYVLDLNGDFDSKLNGYAEKSEILNREDLEIVFSHILDHSVLTGSKLAKEILGNRAHFQERFRKVIPREYKLALEKNAEASKIYV